MANDIGIAKSSWRNETVVRVIYDPADSWWRIRCIRICRTIESKVGYSVDDDICDMAMSGNSIS